MRKTELLAFLQNQTDFFDPDNLSEVFTASWLAQRFAMQRNTASHYLNQLVAQDVLVKINTRPVYFLHKKPSASSSSPFPQRVRQHGGAARGE
jgi:sigma-54 dependent transcriptional regulator of gfr operon